MATDFQDPYIPCDATNPWPFSATVVVSGVNVPISTLTLTAFAPSAADDEGAIWFTNGSTFLTFNANQGWYYGNGSYTFFLATNSRGIPNKSAGAGLSAGWTRYSGTGNVDMFSIEAVAVPRTEWNRRRLVNMGY
jgi:hypothetical protein